MQTKDTDTLSRATLTAQGRSGGVIFVSNLPPYNYAREVLDSEALEPFGKCEKFVMRIFFALLFSRWLSQWTYHHAVLGPGSKSAYFIYSNEDRVKKI